MFCKLIQKDLSAYLDGELGVFKTRIVKSHLAGCSECRKTLEYLKQLSLAVKKAETVCPSNDLMAALRARIAKEAVNRPVLVPKSFFNFKFAFGIASIMLIVTAGFLLFKPNYKINLPEATISHQIGSGMEGPNVLDYATLSKQTRR